MNEYQIIDNDKIGLSTELTFRKYSHIDKFGKGIRLRFNSKLVNLYFSRWNLESSGYTNSYGITHIHKFKYGNFLELGLNYLNYNDNSQWSGSDKICLLGWINKISLSEKKSHNIALFYYYTDRASSNSSDIYAGYNFIYNINNFSIEPGIYIFKRIGKEYGFAKAASVAVSYSILKK